MAPEIAHQVVRTSCYPAGRRLSDGPAADGLTKPA
jgi:hypothetical protein